MNADAVDETVNRAARQILDMFQLDERRSVQPTKIAELVNILKDVHSNGYGHGLHQGHYDYEPGGVFNPDGKLNRRPANVAGVQPAQP